MNTAAIPEEKGRNNHRPVASEGARCLWQLGLCRNRRLAIRDVESVAPAPQDTRALAQEAIRHTLISSWLRQRRARAHLLRNVARRALAVRLLLVVECHQAE